MLRARFVDDDSDFLQGVTDLLAREEVAVTGARSLAPVRDRLKTLDHRLHRYAES